MTCLLIFVAVKVTIPDSISKVLLGMRRGGRDVPGRLGLKDGRISRNVQANCLVKRPAETTDKKSSRDVAPFSTSKRHSPPLPFGRIRLI